MQPLPFYRVIIVNPKRLIEIHDQIDANSKNRRVLVPLLREFEAKKKDLNNLLKQLFDLGNDDALIPLIKELYATN